MLRVGIDQASRHHDVCLASEGQAPSYLRVADDADGLEELLAAIRRLEPDPAQVHVAIEGSGQGLFVAALLAAGVQVYPVNPKAVDRYRDRFSPAGSKDDRRDALVLAEILRTDRHRLQPLRLESETLRQLRVVYSHHQTLVEERTRLLNQLTACRRTYYPRALELFADLGRPWLGPFCAPSRPRLTSPEPVGHGSRNCCVSTVTPAWPARPPNSSSSLASRSSRPIRPPWPFGLAACSFWWISSKPSAASSRPVTSSWRPWCRRTRTAIGFDP